MSYVQHGVATDAFVLSLALSRKQVAVGDAALVDLQLSVDGDTRVDLLRDEPRGTYDVEVDDEGTGKRLQDREGYLVQISQIAVEHVTPQCAAYEALNLNHEYDLKPGRYVVRASRRLVQLKSWKPYRIAHLPTVVSNNVTLEIVP